MNENNSKLISIIILSWNAPYYLERCLDSVFQSNYDNFEVIVSDNNSRASTVDFIKQKFPEARVIRNSTNLGFSGGNNVAIARAKGQVIVLLNQDTVVARDWLQEIHKVMPDPSIGIVGPKLYYGETTIIQSIGFFLYPSGHQNARGAFLKDDGSYDEIIDVDFVSGAALAIKRNVIEEIGLLDENFFAYCEDLDWCYRAKMAGFRVVVAPKAVVRHYGSVSWTQNQLRQAYLTEVNRLRFIVRHFRGTVLLRSLTSWDFLFMLGKVRQFASGNLVSQKEIDRALISNRSNNSRTTIRFVINWLAGRMLAYFRLMFMLRRVRVKEY